MIKKVDTRDIFQALQMSRFQASSPSVAKVRRVQVTKHSDPTSIEGSFIANQDRSALEAIL